MSDRNAGIVAAYRAGGTCRSIGLEYGLSPQGISNVLASRGVSRRPRGCASRCDPTLIAAAYYGEGGTLHSVATAFGISFMTVQAALIRGGYSRRPRGRKPTPGPVAAIPNWVIEAGLEGLFAKIAHAEDEFVASAKCRSVLRSLS